MILSSLRSRKADELDLEIEELEKEIPKKVKLEDTVEVSEEMQLKITKYKSVKSKRSKYRADSRSIAIWIGVVLSVIVSLVAVRILGNLLDVSVLTEKVHINLLIIVDVLLTGLVLAGGSDAINKIMKVFNSFTTNVAEKNKSGTT